jgi:hypothetical protein
MGRLHPKVALLVAAVIALAFASAAIGLHLIAGPSFGSVVIVSLTYSGGPMGEGNGMMHPGIMALNADRATVPHGAVTFRVTNAGVVDHEMVILAMAASQVVGTRPSGGDAKIEETGSLGEASNSGGEGPGEEIAADASSWITVTLAPGQ